MNEITYYLSLCVWLISLNVMSLSSSMLSHVAIILFYGFVLQKTIIIIKAILMELYKMESGSHYDIELGMTPIANCCLKCESFTWSLCSTRTTRQCLCTRSLRMYITWWLDSNFTDISVQFTYTFSTVNSPRKLRFPIPFPEHWLSYLKLEPWIVLPKTPRHSPSPWCSFWVKIQWHYTFATFSLSIHPSRHRWVDSMSWLLWDLLQ